MAKASPQIVTATERNKEQQQKEDFATSNYPTADVLGTDVVAREKRERLLAATQEQEAAKAKKNNQDFNFIDDETFEKELVYLGYTPHSDLILLIAPKIKTPDSAIHLTPDTKNKFMTDQLDKLPSAMRVLAISQKAKMQNTTISAETSASFTDQRVFEEFKAGDYIFYNNNLIMLNNMQPLSKDLMYYQARNMDVRYSITQEQALKFKSKED